MDLIQKTAEALAQADAILIGASNGLSIAEGYHIFANNEMFQRQFGDLQKKYGIRNVIEGCFFQYYQGNDRQEFLQRLVKYWVKDYQPSQVMKDLLEIVSRKDYFVLTSNGDTHLELSGFDDDKVFEIEGTFEQLCNDQPIVDKNRQVQEFLTRYHGKKLVILELGIGMRNRLIKLPLMQLTAQEPQATYITLNLAQELYIPREIEHRSIGLAGDIAVTLHDLKEALKNRQN
ncbi:hypothetical protein [uncultured Bacteroides sp.]|uniref:hypothetical protein n=1 Tax=uncultured Bacteroides sp. TaxID=162156 RepID=UPI002624B4A8|nr:hypothetical protein [uncultured Bacteroides sp.]